MNFASTQSDTYLPETVGRSYSAPQRSPPEIVCYFVATIAAGTMALTTSFISETIANPLGPAVSRSIGELRIPVQLPVQLNDAALEMAGFLEFKDGWDGPGSRSIAQSSIVDALAFLQLLPAEAAAPEALAFGDGTAGWHWPAEDRYLTVLFPGDGRIVYYGEGDAFGAAVKGTALFDRKALPVDLLNMIQA